MNVSPGFSVGPNGENICRSRMNVIHRMRTAQCENEPAINHNDACSALPEACPLR